VVKAVRLPLRAKLHPNQRVGTPGLFTKVRFTQKAAVLIRGAVTGRHYQFHEGAYSQQVDTRDASVLVKTRYFQPDLSCLTLRATFTRRHDQAKNVARNKSQVMQPVSLRDVISIC
jgi:hypothetical protein